MLSQRSFRGALPEEERETLKQTPTQPRFPGEETTRYLSEQIKASRSRRLGGGVLLLFIQHQCPFCYLLGSHYITLSPYGLGRVDSAQGMTHIGITVIGPEMVM